MTLVMWGVIKNNFGEELFWEKNVLLLCYKESIIKIGVQIEDILVEI